MREPYNFRGCQSLFGYASDVHARSQGTCQLCGCGGKDLTFDMWRQLSVEHLIGKAQGGYLKEVRLSVRERYPAWTADEIARFARDVDIANTVTACSFCNATTSQDRCAQSMRELIAGLPDEPVAALELVQRVLADVLLRKRGEVAWKLESVRAAYHERVLPRFMTSTAASFSAGEAK